MQTRPTIAEFILSAWPLLVGLTVVAAVALKSSVLLPHFLVVVALGGIASFCGGFASVSRGLKFAHGRGERIAGRIAMCCSFAAIAIGFWDGIFSAIACFVFFPLAYGQGIELFRWIDIRQRLTPTDNHDWGIASRVKRQPSTLPEQDQAELWNAVSLAIRRADVREVLEVHDRTVETLAALLRLLNGAGVPPELSAQAIRDPETLDWLLSNPNLPEPLDRFPDELTMVRFVNWVKHGIRPPSR